MSNTVRTAAAITAYLSCIVTANWLIDRYGFVSVGFNLVAPAGVYAAGAALFCRDLVHETAGRLAVVLIILAGAALSWTISPAFAVASGVAFLLSESADMLVYSPLRERRRYLAVGLSGTVGSVIDSLVFLWLAFASLDGFLGLTLGKLWTIPPAVLALWCWRRWHRERAIDAAMAWGRS